MVEVRLHGALAKDFGRVWHLDIKTPREAVDAIECGRPGFKDAIMDLDRRGMVFRVRSKTHDYDNEDVNATLGRTSRIDIIPIIRGASAGVRFVIGAVLTVAGTLLTAGFPVLGPMLMTTGISLMLGAVTEWLTPKVKREDEKNVQSWSISGASNIADQGMPVPVIYGEVLTGGTPISGAITVSDIGADGSTAPAVSIGGRFNYYEQVDQNKTYTAVILFSASAFNINDPLTYSWTKSGFTGASAVRLTKVNQATVRLEVDVDIPVVVAPASYVFETTGNISVSCVGKSVSGDGTAANANKTEAVSIKLEVYYYAEVGGA